jgi:DNA-binding MarR family transcriptional regulator
MKEEKLLNKIKRIQIVSNKCIFNDDELKNKRNISNTQQLIIEYMLENKDKDIYQKDLEKDLNFSRATVSSVLKTMERNKAIKRTVSKIDTRTKKIVLKDYAIEAYDKGKKKRKEVALVATENISSKDLETTLKVLDQIDNNLEEYLRRKDEKNLQ